MASSIINVKSSEKDVFLEVKQDDIRDVTLGLKRTGVIEAAASGSKLIDVFSVSFNSTGNVDLYNVLDPLNRDYRTTHSSSGMAYMLQSLFFVNDAEAGRAYVTHPWTGESVTALHCISLSQGLYQDQLLGFNSDIIMSITGDLSLNGNFLGTGSYGTSQLVYTSNTQQSIENNDFVGINSTSNRIIQQFDNAGLDYSIVTARVYHKLSPNIEYYRLRGALLKDYGMIIFFDNQDGWSEYGNIDSIQHYLSGSITGNEANPAVYFQIGDVNISFKKYEEIVQKRIDLSLPWDKGNYSTNSTARDDSSGEYLFTEIDTLDELNKIDKSKHPRSYATKIFLYDNSGNHVATASLSRPVRKDFLSYLNVKIRVNI